MNREELKKHITNFRLNLPQHMKFAVMAESAAVLESAEPLECEYLYVAMERQGHFWALQTYGDMETRLEGSWTGNSWLKVYMCYDQAQVVVIDGTPCQYVPKTNPFQDNPMKNRPVPKLSDYNTTNHPNYNPHPDFDPGALDDLPALILTGKNVDFADVVGDYLGLGGLVDDAMESRSAAKSLLQNPTPLKDSQYGEPQRWKRGVFRTSEYRGRLVKCSEEQLKLTDDPVNNLRRYNGASLKVKVTYKRRLAALARALANESMTAQCMQPPGGHIEPEDHTVDSIAVAMGARREVHEEGVFRRPGILRKQLCMPEPFKFRDVITAPPEVKKTIDDFVGEDTPPVEQTKMGADIDGDFVDGEYYLDPVGKAALERQKKEDDK